MTLKRELKLGLREWHRARSLSKGSCTEPVALGGTQIQVDAKEKNEWNFETEWVETVISQSVGKVRLRDNI